MLKCRNSLILLAAASLLPLPVFGEELKFPMLGDFDQTAPSYYPSHRIEEEDSGPPLQLVKIKSKGTNLEISKEWLSWQTKTAESISDFIKKKGLSFEKVDRPFEFWLTLNDRKHSSTGKRRSSGSKKYDLVVYAALKFGKYPKDHPELDKYKRVTIYGSISPEKPYKITKILGFKDYGYKWVPVTKNRK